jgi:hypothetical protein
MSKLDGSCPLCKGSALILFVRFLASPAHMPPPMAASSQRGTGATAIPVHCESENRILFCAGRTPAI